MARVVWITRDRLPERAEALRKSLEDSGVRSDTVVLPSPDAYTAWSGREPTPPAEAYFFTGSVADVNLLTTWFRESDVPRLWVYDSVEEARAGLSSESLIDDIFHLAGDAKELSLRLRLHRKATQRRIDFDLKLRDQVNRVAKSETTLKQREEFLSVCAHDLRSPLGLIQSSMSLLLNDKNASLSDFHRELITRAKRQAGQAITLVNDLLDVMAYEQGLKPQYHVIHMDKLLREFYEDYRFQAEQKSVSFHYQNPVPEWRVLADSDRIRQLLQNLFTNALKFTERGKNIYLNVESFKGRRKTDPAYPMMVISIRDEGKGIPHSEVEKIFDRFSQIRDHSRSEGRGLGLTVAKQISTSHDGNIWVQSQEGQGSTFFVLFPHVLSRVAAFEAVPRKIVIAEPAATRRDSFFQTLTQWGYDVIYARDGVEAITLLFHHQPEALILSPGLTKLGEVEVANIVKADPLTSATSVFLASEAAQKGQKKHDGMLIDGVLSLPFTRATFEECLVTSPLGRIPSLPKKVA